MSTSRRAYDVLRSYVGREWERLSALDETRAREELRQAMETVSGKRPEATPPNPTPTAEEMSETDRKVLARRILGVEEGTAFAEIRKAFDRLNKRSDPSNFPDDSEEAKRASEIHRRVHWAFELLTQDMDQAEKRFRSLEIES